MRVIEPRAEWVTVLRGSLRFGRSCACITFVNGKKSLVTEVQRTLENFSISKRCTYQIFHSPIVSVRKRKVFLKNSWKTGKVMKMKYDQIITINKCPAQKKVPIVKRF